MIDRLQDIFDHKAISSANFRELQARHGLISDQHIPVLFFTREGQHELHKGIHWINLELSEFIAASFEERTEELADVLHFIVEFCLLAGLGPELIPATEPDKDRLDVLLFASEGDAFVFPDPHTNARFTILAALRVAEMLKNKPWKQTLKTETDFDEDEFRRRVSGMWYWYGATVRTTGVSAQALHDEFLRKEKINYERVNSGV